MFVFLVEEYKIRVISKNIAVKGKMSVVMIGNGRKKGEKIYEKTVY